MYVCLNTNTTIMILVTCHLMIRATTTELYI